MGCTESNSQSNKDTCNISLDHENIFWITVNASEFLFRDRDDGLMKRWFSCPSLEFPCTEIIVRCAAKVTGSGHVDDLSTSLVLKLLRENALVAEEEIPLGLNGVRDGHQIRDRPITELSKPGDFYETNVMSSHNRCNLSISEFSMGLRGINISPPVEASLYDVQLTSCAPGTSSQALTPEYKKLYFDTPKDAKAFQVLTVKAPPAPPRIITRHKVIVPAQFEPGTIVEAKTLGGHMIPFMVPEDAVAGEVYKVVGQPVAVATLSIPCCNPAQSLSSMSWTPSSKLLLSAFSSDSDLKALPHDPSTHKGRRYGATKSRRNGLVIDGNWGSELTYWGETEDEFADGIADEVNNTEGTLEGKEGTLEGKAGQKPAGRRGLRKYNPKKYHKSRR